LLVKNLAHQELLDTIRSVHLGQNVISPGVSSDLAPDATDDYMRRSRAKSTEAE
jgi:hypothetical protein